MADTMASNSSRIPVSFKKNQGIIAEFSQVKKKQHTSGLIKKNYIVRPHAVAGCVGRRRRSLCYPFAPGRDVG